MTRILPFVVFIACAPPEASEVRVDPEVEAWLDPQADSGERTALLEDGRASLYAGGSFIEGERYFEGRHLPVVHAGEELVVRYGSGAVDVLLWVPRQETPSFVYEGSWFGGTDRGVHLPAAATVEVLEADSENVWIEASHRALRVRTFGPAHAVDDVYVSDPYTELEPLDTTAELVGLRPHTEFLDRPGGDVVADWNASYSTPAHAVEWDEGHVRVQFDLDDWRVDAWVDGADVGSFFGGIGSGGSFGCGFASGGSAITLKRGTWLLDTEGGDVVGRVREDASMYVEYVDEGALVPLDTAVGRIELFVEASELPD